jgi:hypothetical protein
MKITRNANLTVQFFNEHRPRAGVLIIPHNLSGDNFLLIILVVKRNASIGLQIIFFTKCIIFCINLYKSFFLIYEVTRKEVMKCQ